MVIANAGLVALTTDAERRELQAAGRREPVKLKRTFNQKIYDKNFQVVRVARFWRVMSEWHKNYQSDLSVDGLREWGII